MLRESMFPYWRYALALWPLPVIFCVTQLVIHWMGNPYRMGLNGWLPLVDLSVNLLTFLIASLWVYRPLMRLPKKVMDSAVGGRKVELVMELFPRLALKGFFFAGLLCSLYLIVAINASAMTYDQPLNWRMQTALALVAFYGYGFLAAALAFALSMLHMVRLRKKLSAAGLFISGIEKAQLVPYLLRTSNRPLLLFVGTSMLPGCILAVDVLLMMGADDVTREYIAFLALMLFVALVAGGSTLTWMGRRILEKVEKELISGLEHMRHGRFSAQIPVLMEDDFGQLARGLNTALSGLRERESLQGALNIAAEIQHGILPDTALEAPGYGMSFLQESCEAVGGDYFDYVALPDGRYWLVMADVAGKGYPAALTVANLQAMLHALGSLNIPFEEAAAYVNRKLVSSMTGGRFVTLFMAKLQPDSNTLLWLNAGHVPPLLLHDGEVQRLEATAPPMGLPGTPHYAVQTLKMAPGDRLLAYTDGVIEARHAQSRALFGEQRLQKWLTASQAVPVDELPKALQQELKSFGMEANEDDLTLWCLEREKT